MFLAQTFRKKIFRFNFLIKLFIYLHVDTSFLYYKEILTFIFEHILVQVQEFLCATNKFVVFMHPGRPRTLHHCQCQKYHLLQFLHYIINIKKRIKNIYIDTDLVLPMHNTHPYFSLKNLGKL